MGPSDNNRFHSLDAEMYVLGCAMQSAAALTLVTTLADDEFYAPENREIFKAIKAVHDAEKPVDLIGVDAQITAQNTNTGGVLSRLMDCYTYAPTTQNVSAYIAQIQGCTARRRALAAIEKAGQSLHDPTVETSVVTESILQAMRDVNAGKSAMLGMKQIMLDTYHDFEARYAGSETVIQSGIDGLDDLTGGFHPGELTIIGARTSVGKSALGAVIAANAATGQGRNVFVCSREMDAVQYGQRLLARFADVDANRFRKPKDTTEDEFDKIGQAMSDLSHAPLTFTFSVKTVEELRAETTRMVDREGIEMLVVDYLTQLQTVERFPSEHMRVTYISRILKEIALDLHIPVIALAQIKRLESPRMPRLEDLKESGSIEQDADSVILMHRPVDKRDDSYGANELAIREIEGRGDQFIMVQVAKQRQGKTGRLDLLFNASRMRYFELTRREPQ